MITKSAIQKKTNSITFSKGMDLYRMNKVKRFSVEEDEEFDYIEAKVKGSGSNTYEVTASYDIEEDRIEDTYCECPAFASYRGICKHGVAVLLEYLNYSKRNLVQSKEELKQQAALEMLKALKGDRETKPVQKSKTAQAKIALQTTPEIKKLLSNRIRRHTLQVLQATELGKVRLEPYLHGHGQLQLEFKIGITHMYVLKDIFSFDRAFEQCEAVSYGQKLQFTHTLEAFEDGSREWVQFIRRWVRRYKMKYTMGAYYSIYSYSYAYPKTRDLMLQPEDLDELYEALGDRAILADVDGTGDRRWQPAEGNPPRQMTITGKKEGIQVKINYLGGYQGDKINLYFHEGKIYRTLQKEWEPIGDFMKCMSALPNRTIAIHRDDVPLFCRELLPALEQYFTCIKDEFDEKDYGILPVSFQIYLDAPQKDMITCQAMAVYGEGQYNIYNKSEQTNIRDMIAEAEMEKLISAFCNAFDSEEKLMVVAEDEDRLYDFLVYGIPKLQEVAQVFISDALKRFRVTSAPKVAVGVSITGDIMNLKLTSDDMSREQLLEILSRYNRKKKFYRLKNGDFINVQGEELEALLELKQSLHLSEAQLRKSTIEVPRYRALYLDSELKERASLQVTKDKNFRELVRNMKTVEDNDFELPDSLAHTLREYQKRGFLWIKTLKANGFGGILADDMGLGKTLQVICYLLSEHTDAKRGENQRALIVCPASLVYNWNSEIQRFAPSLTAKMVIGTVRERKEIIQNVGDRDILITSYDLLKRDLEAYEDVVFHSEIIDEAQFIKNHTTLAAQSVKQIHAAFKLALTGTPIENRLSELWSIFDYLMPGFLYSYQRFHDELELAIVQKNDPSAVRRLQRMISPFVLRRLKKEVLADLPDKLEEEIYASLEGEQQKLYDAHVKKLQLLLDNQSEEEFKTSKLQLLSELTRLRQICCDPALLYEGYRAGSAKTELCLELIRNAISSGHKILLFSQFTSMLERLRQKLEEENISYYLLTGATSKEKRSRMVTEFNKDDTSVFCISLKAGGTGLNLTAADIVIHFDPWWNLAVQNQATDRAHRIGQTNVVTVYKLIVKGTIEENIMKIQEQKKELAEQVIGGEGMNLGSFTKEELLELLR